MVRKLREDYRAQVAMQSQLRILPYTYHGRGKKYDLTVPNIDRLRESRGQEELRHQASNSLYFRNPHKDLLTITLVVVTCSTLVVS